MSACRPRGGQHAGQADLHEGHASGDIREEFIEFATGASPQVQRTAFLLCGDWHTAEDLVQSTPAKVFVSWRRIKRRDAACAYATRTLVNAYLTDKRLKRSGEVITDQFPEHPAESQAPESLDWVDVF